MSWFDGSGLASLAKSALKEAQKKIDKALDIKDEELSHSTTTVVGSSSTEPATPSEALYSLESNAALWGSFSGSFFETSKLAVTTTPPRCGFPSTDIQQYTMQQKSIQSISDSVEILSGSTTPCSELLTAQNSESVEVITTPNSSEFLSQNCVETPGSIEEILDDDVDAISFSTVMDESMPSASNDLLISKASVIEKDLYDQCEIESDKTLAETNQPGATTTTHAGDTYAESQTVSSDSTQSFEDIQMPNNSCELKNVKCLSGGNSGHTSADEVETTTSSDIEIISNPYGDSSSANSGCRASPVKCRMTPNKREKTMELSLNKKGHYREPSEASTQSDDSQSETDKMLRRISELSEILEAREIRLLEIGKQNAELQAKNMEYESLLEAKQKKTENIEAEEYTHRLSALEKKFQMSIRERDALRDQLKSVKAESAEKIAKNDLDKLTSEKNYIIEELQAEGEKLSKQVLQHSNIIKKLRVKHKESDDMLKKNRDQLIELTEEVERLKKSLTAKEEVERTQIEAVHRLSSDKRRLEKENELLKSQVDELSSKLSTLSTSLNVANKQLEEKKLAFLELTRKTEEITLLESEKKITQTQNEEIFTQVIDLRNKLKVAEMQNSLREQKLTKDNSDLLRRLETAELRAEELCQDVSLATTPLAKQLDALQATLAQRTLTWEKQEKELTEKLEEEKQNLKALKKAELKAQEDNSKFSIRIKGLEEKLSVALLDCERANGISEEIRTDFSQKESEYQLEIENLKTELEKSQKLLNDQKDKLLMMQESMEMHQKLNRKIFVEELPSINSPRHSISEEPANIMETTNVTIDETGGNSSPTLSLGHNSLADSLASLPWQMDDLDCISNQGRPSHGSIHGVSSNFGQMGNTATVVEKLQSSLKQRDGELHQLQWELSRLQAERNVFNTEISNLTLDLENAKEKFVTHQNLKKEFTDLQCQYDALLQMYGEKVEESQELELDLQDVKEMYKAQIDELLQQKQITE